MFQLTNDQQQGLEFLQSNYQKNLSCVLTGSAGTGKTTLISEFIRTLPPYKVVVTTPTHKALQVLREKVGNSAFNYRTIHSALELKKFYEGSNVVFRPNPRYPLENKVIVSDESSMIGDFLLGHINDSFARNNTYLFLGDLKQLPPVNEENSPIFNNGFPSFNLNQIVRQADGNDIITLSMNLGKLLSKKDGQNYSWKKLDQLMDKLVESNGSDQCKYLSWTNKTVDRVNNQVRTAIYGNPEQFEEGETIRFNESYREIYHNSQEITVLTIQEDKVEGFDCWRINNNILVIHNEAIHHYKKKMKELYKDCDNNIRQWDEYHSMRELFANVGYNHALTVHKSQGSTYDEAIINISEIKSNPNRDEMTRMIYTALTRARLHDYLM